VKKKTIFEMKKSIGFSEEKKRSFLFKKTKANVSYRSQIVKTEGNIDFKIH
jgi:hypothetical protein